MEKFPLQPTFLKNQLLHSYGPQDLMRMQEAFEHLCSEIAFPLDKVGKDRLASAIVRAYDSKMTEEMLLAAARFVYDGFAPRVAA
jgi:hypothetical protein